jgi:very-short-patch-repair endonuclease
MDKPRKMYIEYWNNLSDEQKTELIIKRTAHFTKCGFSSSKLETKITDCLDKLNISYISQFRLGRKIYDIRILNTDIIIEVNGDFWHGNPNFYKDDDIIHHPFKHVTAKELWIKDEKKKEIAESKGFNIIYIWEDEINKNKNNLINMLINKIK